MGGPEWSWLGLCHFNLVKVIFQTPAQALQSLYNGSMQKTSLLQDFHSSPAQLLETCARFGLPVPPTGVGPANLWIRTQPQPLTQLEAALQMLCDGTCPADAELALHLPEPWLELGCASLEAEYSEDLVLSRQQSLTLSREPGDARQSDDLHVRLQDLFQDLRLLLGDRDWLVFWAHSASQIWLLGLWPWKWSWDAQSGWLPLSDLPLGLSPALLSLEMLKQAAAEWHELLASRQALEPNPAQACHWLESLGGQVCFNAAASQAMLGFQPNQSQRLSPAAIWRIWRWPARVRQSLEQIWETFTIPHSSLTGYLNQWREILRVFLPVYLQGQQQIRSLQALLQQQELLEDYLALHLSPMTRMQQDLDNLREAVQQMTLNQEGEPPSMKQLLRNPEFRTSWQLFLSDYGHLAPFGLDLAAARYADQGQALMALLKQTWGPDEIGGVELSWRHRLWQPFWGELRRLLKTQDDFLSDTLWALQQLRQQVLKLAQQAVEAGHLQHPDELWWLWPEEVNRLSAGQNLSELSPQLKTRRERFATWHGVWQTGPELPPDTTLQGQGLQLGLKQGQVWRPQHPLELRPAQFKPEQTLLLAEQVDAGWIPCLVQVAGVILTGSDRLSRSAGLLREMGLNTVLNLPEARGLQTGNWVRINAETGTLTVLAAATESSPAESAESV